MDPLSISVSCLTLVATISRLSISVSTFIDDVRAARTDLLAVDRELSSLQAILKLLAKDTEHTSDHIPSEAIQVQIRGIITNCTGLLEEMERTLRRYGGTRIDKAAKWAISGKGDIAKLRSSLESHKSALQIALDMIDMYGILSSIWWFS